MNKNIITLISILAIAGCAKEIDTIVPEDPIVKNTVTISAGVADDEASGTKTTVDGATFSWSAGETISVGTSDDVFVSFEVSDPAKGEFTHTFDGPAPTLIAAVSPARPLVDGFDSDGMYYLTFPDSYDYIAGNTNAIMIAGAPTFEDGKYRFAFRNACSLMKITYENVPVGTTGFVLTAKENITGQVLMLTTDTEVTNENNDLDGKTVTINISDPVSDLNTSYTFYIPLPTGTYTAGMNFYLTNASGKIVSTEKTTKKALSLERADVFNAKTISLAPAVPATRGTILYKEEFNDFSTGDTPVESGASTVVYGSGTVSYSYTGNTKVQGGTMFAGGEEPELIIYKDYKAFSVSDIPTGLNKKLTLRYKSNNGVSLSTSTDGVSIADPTNVSNDYEAVITLSKYIETFDLTFTNNVDSKGSNTRLDNIVIAAGDPLAASGIEFPQSSYTAITELGFIAPTLTNPNGLTVSYSSSNTSVATVNSSTGEISLVDNGETIITATYPGDGETYAPSEVSYTLSVEDAVLTLSAATSPAKAESSAGSTVTFTVTSNIDWTATIGTDEDDIIDSITDDGNGTVTVTFNKNSVASEKSATITISPEADALKASFTRNIIVTQKGYENVDVLDREWTGIANNGSYGNWSNKVGSSSGNKYSGNSAGGNNSIQLRASDNSGIVSTYSENNDIIAKVTVSWNSNTTTPRGIEVYGKNTAYTAPSDLYSDENKGTLIGTLNKTAANGTAQTLELTSIAGNYKFIGLRATGGANYLDEIRIEWTTLDPSAPKLSTDVTSLDWTWNNTSAKTINVTTNASTPNSFTVTPASMDWATVSTDGNTITVTPKSTNASTVSDNSGTITIHHEAGTIDDVVVTCTQEKAPNHEISIKTDPSRINLSGTKDTPTAITVVSNYAWTASNTGSGYSISPTTGSAGETVVTITPTADGGATETKLGDITFTDNLDAGTKVTKDIYQAAKIDSPVFEFLYTNERTSDNSTELSTSNAPLQGYFTSASKIYEGKDGYLKFGTGSAIGRLTTISLDLSKSFTVSMVVKKYGTDTGHVTVTCGEQIWDITPSTSGSTETHDFSGESSSATLVISTTSKRAYVTNIVVTYK